MNGDFTGLMYSFSGQTEVKIELLVNIQLLEKNEKRVVFFWEHDGHVSCNSVCENNCNIYSFAIG